VPTGELVDRNAATFHDLRGPLQISFDDFIRTSADPRHKVGVDRLWQATDESGDLSRKHYEGLNTSNRTVEHSPMTATPGLVPPKPA
jgi:methionyl-tRNA synthetase